MIKPLRILCSGLWVSLCCASVAHSIEKIDLFVVGDDPAYARYHIPGVTVTAQGTVLAWCEARNAESDWADIDILLRRSTDGGKSWSAAKSIAKLDEEKR